MTIRSSGPIVWGPHSCVGAVTMATTFTIDQAHKAWMLHGYGLRERGREAVTPFLDWVFVLNRGVSYGLLPSAGQWLLTTFAIAAAFAMWVWLARAGTGRLMAISLGFIMGGALGNALDRMLYGGVVDYVSLHAFGFYWYVFNIADAAIVAGVAGLLYESLLTNRGRIDASKTAQDG
jgi:signal peptidase II